MGRWRVLRIFSLALAATLAMQATAFARVLYACQMSGKVGQGCCCHGSSEASPTGGETAERARHAVDRPSCCKLEMDPAHRHFLAAKAEGMPAMASLPPSSSPVQVVPHAVRQADVWRPTRIRGPPAPTIPLYIKHRSLLN